MTATQNPAATAPSAEAINAAGRIVLEARRVRDSLPVEEAARRAWTPTGPSIEELEAMIRAQREPGASQPSHAAA
jgi:hypothetical protein